MKIATSSAVAQPRPQSTSGGANSRPTSEPADEYAGTVPLNPTELRKTFGRFASGVTVVTTGEGENRHGMTASSFTSVSMDPPLVMFCANNQSGTLAAIQENGTFAVNVLGAEQKDACFAFAGKGDGDRFAGRSVQAGPATRTPLLPEALAQFECKVWNIVPGGDHQIVIGEVVALHRRDSPGDPMVFWGGNLQNAQNWKEK